ncbi:transporter substrate-binding domain-containing protein [Olsenella uli]|uniref:transporter substrate-binding domain-containing protein n=1 Tax=Olsenella uli TaxID=133926 RepID=UPI00195B6975|nr:transporter substrate-binding domain-containing protein [Olsenella uli]MBM6675886.1 transporter substrate-binding domain-containing protein [Olsenella uli]
MSASVSRRTFLGIAGGAASVLGLAACGGNNAASDDANAASDDADGKTYLVATDTTFAPFEFTNDQNEFVGIDVDLLAAIAADQGFKYELNSLGFDAAVAALESNQADAVIAGMSITPEREEDYDFTDSYYQSSVCAAVKAGSDVKGLEDLKGQKVAGKTGTQSLSWAESIKDEYGFEITYFDTSDMMYQDVQTGNSAACFEDTPVMEYGVAQGNGLEIVAKEEDEFASPYGLAVMKGKNPELVEMFNAGLANIKESGEYDEILAKYLEA